MSKIFLPWGPAIALAILPALSQAQLQFTSYNVQNAPSGYAMIPQRLTIGADGNLWYTEYQPNYGEDRVGRITTTGAITEFRAILGPSGYVGPRMGFGITSLAGKLWYLEAAYLKTGRMDPLNPYPSGPFDEFSSNQHPYTGMDMIAGPDGKLWYTQYNYLTRYNPSGYDDGAWQVGSAWTQQPIRICLGPDGNMWTTVWYTGVTTVNPASPSNTGATTYSLSWPYIPTPAGIATGADGRLWITGTPHAGSGQAAIVAMSTNGTPTYYTTGTTQNTRTTYVTSGPDGNLWATGSDNAGSGLVRINTGGAFTMFHFPNTATSANDVITGPDGCLWVAGGLGNQGQIIQACLPGPRGTNITSPAADGVYVTGNSLDITVTFSAPVVVSGSPRLALNSGGSAVYVSGSGGNVLTFTYTVQAGETTSRLDGAAAAPNYLTNLPGRAMAVRLNGGTIRDASGNDAILLLPVYPTVGSLASNKLLAINPPDSTPPVSTASASPGPNANGWNSSDVTVSISAIDLGGSGVNHIQYALSGAQNSMPQIVPGSSATVLLNVEGTTTISYFATDNIGNVEAAKTLTVRLDKTGPSVTFSPASPAPNAAGWNNTSVSIAFTFSDSLSGIDTVSQASPLSLSAEGSAVTGTVTVADKAGNTVTFLSPTVKIDKTPPLMSASRAPAPNANNWNNTNVTVSFSCSDALSGLAPGSPPADTTLSADGANQSASGTCQDLAGNTAVAAVSGINIDKTPPTLTFGAQSPPANGNGWNGTNVSFAYTVSDNLSGVVSSSPASPLSLSAEGSAVSGAVVVTDMAGNQATFTSPVVKIDKTPPSIVLVSRLPAANGNGWNNSDVTVSWNCTDSLSGGVSASVSQVVAAEGANQSATGACTDLAGNSAQSTQPGINIDKTKPVAAAAVSPPPNTNGWNHTDVVVTFSGADSLSGIDSCTAAATVATEGSNLTSPPGTCTDRAGNVSDSVTASAIKIDKTAPTVTFGAATPAPNSNGWNNTSVSAPFTVADNLSGVASSSPVSPLILSAQGTAVNGVVVVTDAAGNTATVSSPAFRIDTGAPALSGSRSPAPDVNGWNNTDVTVTFSCADSLSGVASLSPGPSVAVSSEGANQAVSGACQDLGGNVASTTVGPINIDKTNPIVSNVSADPSVVPVNSGFTLSAIVADAGSGVASAQYNVDNGSFADLTLTDAASGLWSATLAPLALGVHTICVRGADKALNQADSICILLPVYDPAGGFVTGGGWILSPVGAYTANPSLTGKAAFGFSAKYQNGASAPSGDTQFQFQMANLSFKSTAYDWLVVSGSRAQFKGSGTINGSGNYGFLLTAVDGDIAGGGGVDKFRIKIVDGSGGIVYDNQMGKDDTGNDATALGGGSIVIHR